MPVSVTQQTFDTTGWYLVLPYNENRLSWIYSNFLIVGGGFYGFAMSKSFFSVSGVNYPSIQFANNTGEGMYWQRHGEMVWQNMYVYYDTLSAPGARGSIIVTEWTGTGKTNSNNLTPVNTKFDGQIVTIPDHAANGPVPKKITPSACDTVKNLILKLYGK